MSRPPTWVRCRDPLTGHEFDLSPRDVRVRRGDVVVLKRYRRNNTNRPRPAKYRVPLGQKPNNRRSNRDG